MLYQLSPAFFLPQCESDGNPRRSHQKKQQQKNTTKHPPLPSVRLSVVMARPDPDRGTGRGRRVNPSIASRWVVFTGPQPSVRERRHPHGPHDRRQLRRHMPRVSHPAAPRGIADKAHWCRKVGGCPWFESIQLFKGNRSPTPPPLPPRETTGWFCNFCKRQVNCGGKVKK